MHALHAVMLYITTIFYCSERQGHNYNLGSYMLL